MVLLPWVFVPSHSDLLRLSLGFLSIPSAGGAFRAVSEFLGCVWSSLLKGGVTKRSLYTRE